MVKHEKDTKPPQYAPFSMGAIAIEAEQWSLAVEAFTNAIALGDTSKEVYVGRALAWLRLGFRGKADADIQKAFGEGNPPEPMDKETFRWVQLIYKERDIFRPAMTRAEMRRRRLTKRAWKEYLIVTFIVIFLLLLVDGRIFAGIGIVWSLYTIGRWVGFMVFYSVIEDSEEYKERIRRIRRIGGED